MESLYSLVASNRSSMVLAKEQVVEGATRFVTRGNPSFELAEAEHLSAALYRSLVRLKE